MIAEIVSRLFNMSISQGKFPLALKNAKVILIHKGDSRLEMSNYRPVRVHSLVAETDGHWTLASFLYGSRGRRETIKSSNVSSI